MPRFIENFGTGMSFGGIMVAFLANSSISSFPGIPDSLQCRRVHELSLIMIANHSYTLPLQILIIGTILYDENQFL